MDTLFIEGLLPLMGFVLVSTLTPGPNNFLLAASGLKFGVVQTVPHVLGIHLGVYTLVVLCGFGLGQMLMAIPELLIGLKVFATVYLCYLAWKILGFELNGDQQVHQPMKIPEAWLFQFSNPKAWMMATTGLNFAYVVDTNMFFAVTLLCCCFATLGACCNFLWVWMGASMRSLLMNPKTRRWINGSLAVITVSTIAAFWAG